MTTTKRRTATELENAIVETFRAVYETQAGEAFDGSLDHDTVLLETGLDSLGFAILVTRLDEVLGYDPFTLADEPFYPRTFGEFLGFYREHAPE